MAVKIIYIAGDGRSGSTLLESILSTNPDTISVGEAYRFWERYYQHKTLCGCGKAIGECELWSNVANDLDKIPTYNPDDFLHGIKKLLTISAFNNIESVLEKDLRMRQVVINFYESIALHAGKNCIIDSSKTPSWCKILLSLKCFDVKIIHLERALPQVAESWKKKIKLPDYIEEERYMPVKGNLNILRTWLRVKILASRLRKSDYFFLRYERLCKNPAEVLQALSGFTGVALTRKEELYMRNNHGIAGNPIRLTNDKTRIEIVPQVSRRNKLGRVTFSLFLAVDKVSNLFIR
jgi:hypothetical protein